MIIEGDDELGLNTENEDLRSNGQQNDEDGQIERRDIRGVSKRQSIAEKFAAMREAEYGGDDGNLDEDIPDTRAQNQQSRVRDDDEPGQQQQPQRRKLKVNGREVELTEEEVTKYAQQALASGDILEQAKAARAEAFEKLNILNKLEATLPTSQPEYRQPEQRQDENTTLNDDELDDIIDSIQVGETKEAKAALMKYGSQIEKRIMAQVGDLDERIQKTTEETQAKNARKERAEKTLGQFANDYPEFKTPALQSALLVETVSNMRSELTNQGVQPETIAGIRQSYNMGENEAVAFAYRTLQEKGFQLPEHGEILSRSAKSIRTQFGIAPTRAPRTDPPAIPQDRQERKRMLTSQPRRANSPPSETSNEPDIMDVRRDAVRQMRMLRRGR